MSLLNRFPLIRLFQWLLTSCANSSKSLYISSCMCEKFILLEYSRRERNTTYPCRYVCIYCMYTVLMKGYPLISLILASCFCYIFVDVMSPRAESVYPRYPSLCKATHWEGKMRPDAENNVGNHISSLIYMCPIPSQNDAEKVVVVIMDKEHHPVERFVFEISQPTLLSIRCFVFSNYNQ